MGKPQTVWCGVDARDPRHASEQSLQHAPVTASQFKDGVLWSHTFHDGFNFCLEVLLDPCWSEVIAPSQSLGRENLAVVAAVHPSVYAL